MKDFRSTCQHLSRQKPRLNRSHEAEILNLRKQADSLHKDGDLLGAEQKFLMALRLDPSRAASHYNLGVIREDQGNLKAATCAYRKALSIKPDFPDARWNLSLLLLKTGDYKRGWKEYESRFAARNGIELDPRPPIKQWNQYSLSPVDVLHLVSEQGLGDTLQFMRYVLHLNNTGRSASLYAPTKLHGLIRASGITRMIYDREQVGRLTTGKWLPLLSLPRYLQVRPGNPVIKLPYIKAPEQRVEYWQRKMVAEQRPIVGINWQGNPEYEACRTAKGRSLPLESFAPIIEKTTIRLLSLQKDYGSEQFAGCSFRHRFVGCQEEISQTRDFVEMAAIIANCDLVITSCTAGAHLAAGMGHPTWLLLHTTSDWRWGGLQGTPVSGTLP